MATSAPIEGIFSEFNNIITKNRNSLSDEVTIKTILLKIGNCQKLQWIRIILKILLMKVNLRISQILNYLIKFN